MNDKQLQESIFNAFVNVINEAATPMFKVGDKVGIGEHGSYASGYHAHDTGTVTKVNKFGHHTVQYDNRKSADDASKPLEGSFDASGKSRREYSKVRLTNLSNHNEMVKAVQDKQERSKDLHEVAQHLQDHRLGTGHFAKLSPSAAARMKELIDKHTSVSED